jgi:hypothetical protein
MTKPELMTQWRISSELPLAFELCHSFVIRHSCFVISPSYPRRPNEKFVAAECDDQHAGSVRSPPGFRSTASAAVWDAASALAGIGGVGVGLIVSVGVALGVRPPRNPNPHLFSYRH